MRFNEWLKSVKPDDTIQKMVFVHGFQWTSIGDFYKNVPLLVEISKANINVCADVYENDGAVAAQYWAVIKGEVSLAATEDIRSWLADEDDVSDNGGPIEGGRCCCIGHEAVVTTATELTNKGRKTGNGEFWLKNFEVVRFGFKQSEFEKAPKRVAWFRQQAHIFGLPCA